MRFINIDKKITFEIPHTMTWLKNIEPKVNNAGCEITIRDTDHRFDSIRIEVKSEKQEYDDTAWEFEKQIYDYISTHCCKCGSTKGVKTIGENTLTSTVCIDCRELMSAHGHQVEGLELALISAMKQMKPVPKIKCRVKAEDGHIFYKYSSDLSYIDGNFVVIENEKVETVTLCGVYTGLRDLKGERIYTGDVILAEDKDSKKFWGMIMFGNKWGKSDRDISPQWNNFCLEHGFDSFPSALSWAKRIEVIGNVALCTQYKGPIPTADDYMNYYVDGHDKYEHHFSNE